MTIKANTPKKDRPGTRLEHWRRPLKDGGVEFYFRAGDAKFSGSVSPARDVHGLMDIFERVHGVVLPEPEIKPSRKAK